MKKNTANDFGGQTVYVGLDVHKKSWKVCIRTNHRFLKVLSMNPSVEALYTFLTKHYPGADYSVVYEAGFCGFWIQRSLTELNVSTIVVNPGDVPTNNKERERKSDTIDCRKLARSLENGELKGIYVPTPEQEHLRALGRLRFQLVKREVQLKNRIKSFAMLGNQTIPTNSELKHWSGTFIKYLQRLEYGDAYANYVRDSLLHQLQQTRDNKAALMKTLRTVYRSNKEIGQTINLLRSVAGIGEVTALMLYLEIMDITRFSNAEKFASSIGVVPSIRSSDERASTVEMTNRHMRYLRYLIIEATWVAIGLDPSLTAHYTKLCKNGKPKNRAIVHIANRLVRRIYRVWRSGEPYQLLQ